MLQNVLRIEKFAYNVWNILILHLKYNLTVRTGSKNFERFV